ncbi:hypothetical protein QPM17_00250 [Marinobacter sp. TBZ242]|uniref:Transferrin-binding protein B C-lobe/N-lobe beta barrel domain-containing protein n=1 Tax=Marinobacter azerbaijanicus TaxID=3050455 RepID=A0ABT7I635_9GAMM|nr:hypothetical protein [Marinobacter sp. TBZ242]MDL0429542.1 hypothetical protein [Marinobacter sp. TBZ242]
MFKLPRNTLSRFPLLFATLALAACGGGGSSGTTVVNTGSSVDETPEDTSSGSDDFVGEGVKEFFVGEDATLKAGAFLGRVNYTDDTPSVDGFMLLSATGNFTFILDTDSDPSRDASIVLGTLTLDGPEIEGAAIEYDLFEKWYRFTGSIAGSVVSNESAILYTGGIVDNTEINRDAGVSDQSLSFNQIAGIYEANGSDPQITVDVDGGINGVDRGCIIKGQITIPVAEINVYELSYESSGCSDLAKSTGEERDGDYLGVGTFTSPDLEGEGKIEFAASNGEIAFHFAGTR